MANAYQLISIEQVDGLAAALEASQILAALLTVDGPNSLLNADLLDGYSSDNFVFTSAYTAADVLAKLLTVDGAGSNVDADTLDGYHASSFVLAGASYVNSFNGRTGAVTLASLDVTNALGFTPLNAATYTAADVLAKLLTVDGAGSNVDADTLDGYHASSFVLAGASYVNSFNGRTGVVTLTSGDVTTALGFTPLNAAAYTAADALSKLLTVDGAGSNLDADFFDGYDSTAFPRKAENAAISGTWAFDNGITISSIWRFDDASGIMSWGSGYGQGIMSWDTNLAILGAQSGSALALWAGGAERARILTSGNFGIGTSSPQDKLHVVGGNASTLRIDNTGQQYTSVDWYNNNSSKATIYYDNVGAEFVTRTTTSAGIGFDTNLTRRVTISPGGSVGIGINSPGAKLDVSGSIQTTQGSGGTITAYDNDAVRNQRLIMGANANGSFLNSTYSSGGTGSLNFMTINYERLRITEDGNVGIGTTSPSKRLHIEETSSSTTATAGVLISNPSNTTNSRAGIVFLNYDNTGAAIWSPRTGNSTGALVFATNTGAGIGETNVTEKMRVTSTGIVVIGATTAVGTELLSVNGRIRAGSFRDYDVQDGTFYGAEPTNTLTALTLHQAGVSTIMLGSKANDTSLYLTNDYAGAGLGYAPTSISLTSGGNVGIGIAAPTHKLQIVGASGSDVIAKVQAGSSNDAAMLSLHGGREWRLKASDSDVDTSKFVIRDESVSADRLVIDYLGLVGIGTSAPTAALDVVGADGGGLQYRTSTRTIGIGQVSSEAAIYWGSGTRLNFTSGGATPMTILASGNVGIGTASPATSLDLYRAGTSTIRMSSVNGAYFTDFINAVDSANSFRIQHNGVDLLHATSQGYENLALGTGGYTFNSSYANAYVSIKTASTERLRIDSSGRLLVGQTSALNNGTIDVLGTGRQAIVARVTDNVNSLFQGFNAASALSVQIDGSGNGYFAGNVGIGTASPTLKLDVVGAALFTVADNTYAAAFNATTGNMRLYPYNSTYSGPSIAAFSAGYAGYAPFTIDAATIRLWTAGTERVRIDGSGNVGIGTISPAHRLTVTGGHLAVESGSAYLASSYSLQFNYGVDNNYYITKSGTNLYLNTGGTFAMMSGNVGIGTSSPTSTLQVNYSNPVNVPAAGASGHALAVGTSGYGLAAGVRTNGDVYLQSTRWDGSATNYHMLLQPNGGSVLINRTSYSGYGKLNVDGGADFTAGNVLMCRDSGYVGIGTASPGTVRLRVLGVNGDWASYLSGSATTSQSYGVLIDAGTNQSDSAFRIRSYGGADYVHVRGDGNVGIGTASPIYKLEVVGSFAATTKSFVIDHPTKPDMKLRYGSLEGPENGVYVRGRLTTNTIELPDYWTGLVDEDTITVNLTPIGKRQDLYVESIADNKIIVGGENINCFYTVFAERKDVEKLEVEFAHECSV